jgi:hypothetical protein
MNFLSRYEGWELSEPRIARTQLNMEVGLVKAKRDNPLSGIERNVLLIISNNNTQYECMISEEAWKFLNKEE